MVKKLFLLDFLHDCMAFVGEKFLRKRDQDNVIVC